MSVTISGDGTLTGIAVGGLPDGVVDTDTLATDAVTAAKIGSLPAGTVLQVVQVIKTDAVSQSTSGSTNYDIMNASITPSSASSKILVTLQLNSSVSGPFDSLGVNLRRGSTTIYRGDEAGSRKQFSGTVDLPSNTKRTNVMFINYLDSPATTSETTYTIRFVDANADSGTFYINRGSSDTNNASHMRVPSSLTLTEVAG